MMAAESQCSGPAPTAAWPTFVGDEAEEAWDDCLAMMAALEMVLRSMVSSSPVGRKA